MNNAGIFMCKETALEVRSDEFVRYEYMIKIGIGIIKYISNDIVYAFRPGVPLERFCYMSNDMTTS